MNLGFQKLFVQSNFHHLYFLQIFALKLHYLNFVMHFVIFTSVTQNISVLQAENTLTTMLKK